MSVLDYIDSSILSPVYKNKIPLIVSNNIDAICRELYFAIKSKEPIFVYGDYDMDGFCCQKVWSEVLTNLYDVPVVHFMYSRRTHHIDSSIVEQVKSSPARVVLICDTGSNYEDHEIVALLRSSGYVPIIVDHHVWEGDYKKDTKHQLIFNSHEESDCLGGYKISGAYACLLIANVLCTNYFNHSLSYNAMVYALASMYSDCVDLSTPIGRVLYNTVIMLGMPGPSLLTAMNERNYRYGKRFFSFIIAPKINACFRTERFGALNRALTVTDRYEIKSVVEELKEIHEEATKLVPMLVPQFEKERFGSILLCTHKATFETRALHVRNFSGLIANSIANSSKSAVVTLIYDNEHYEGSYRDYSGRKMLETFQLFCDAGGHDSAFGLKIYNMAEFRRHLDVLSKALEVEIKKDYVVLSSRLIESDMDLEALAVYNEYRNVQPRVLLLHRCDSIRTILSTKYRKVYDIGLPYPVTTTMPLYDGLNILMEPTISKSVELRCIE